MLRRPIFAIIAFIALIVLFGWIVFSIPWGGRDKERGIIKEVPALVDYADTDTKVQLIENGDINSDEEHREIWITVGRDQVVAEVKQGYEGVTIKTAKFTNNVNAYRIFLAAIDGQGFAASKEYDGKETEAGACPKGIRYIFDTFNSSETIQHTWTTSCSKSIGTFAGKTDMVRQLFEGQVPNFEEFDDDVDL